MTPALTAILDRIEAGTVRIRWAHDDEHALNEAQAMAADVRSLLVLLADTAHTEPDPLPDPYEVAERMAVPRRNCRTCANDWQDEYGFYRCKVIDRGFMAGGGGLCAQVEEWVADDANVPDDRTRSTYAADNCPGYTLRLPTTGERNTVGK